MDDWQWDADGTLRPARWREDGGEGGRPDWGSAIGIAGPNPAVRRGRAANGDTIHGCSDSSVDIQFLATNSSAFRMKTFSGADFWRRPIGQQKFGRETDDRTLCGGSEDER
jgi:hypothetical protein